MKISYHERDYNFGQTILTLRSAIGLTQERLGSLLGVSTRSVAGWEGGSNYPKTKHLKTLIELAIQHQAFPKDRAAEEIRRLWKESHQKVLLDEDWLSTLLSQQHYQPSDVEPEARSPVPSLLPNAGTGPDKRFRTTGPLGEDQTATIGTDRAGPYPVHCADPVSTMWEGRSPYLPQEISITPDPSHRDRTDPWHEARGHSKVTNRHETPDRDSRDDPVRLIGQAQDAVPTTPVRPNPHDVRSSKRHKWLLLSLMALVLLTIIGSVGTLFLYSKNHATDQAYPAYLPGHGTLAFFDPLSQERGSKWMSSRLNSSGGACQFAGGAYHISQQQVSGSFASCLADGIFDNFAFEVQLTITQGDCGGVLFRYNDTMDYYYFILRQDGSYWLSRYIKNNIKFLYAGRSSALHTGLGQQNTIAIVAYGSTMTIYANEQQIAQAQDSSYTMGAIGLVADPAFRHATDVAYRNAKVWTL